MDQLRIVVANDPRAYREAIAGVLQALRPQVVVVNVEPDDLDREVAEHPPQVVTCSRLTEVVQARSRSWVVLYPDGQAWSSINIAGQQTTVTGIEVDDLLAVADQTAQLAQAR
ncbi:MAG: hypothetical protein M3Q65_10390 [Chloroflexota bacterium]|nr:hypothetical protein [Chloroflexota bacterium]